MNQEEKMQKNFRVCLFACKAALILHLAVVGHAEDALSKLLEAQDEQQHALSHTISGTTAAVHSSINFAHQLQLDTDPTELLINADSNSHQHSSAIVHQPNGPPQGSTVELDAKITCSGQPCVQERGARADRMINYQAMQKKRERGGDVPSGTDWASVAGLMQQILGLSRCSIMLLCISFERHAA